MTSAGLTFLSWVRTGLVSTLDTPANASGNPLDAILPITATLRVDVKIEGVVDTSTFEENLFGPGHVTGLEPRRVLRTDPPPGAVDVPPNYFAVIEFDRPDLPWMLTPNAPAKASLSDQDPRRGLRPWLCLVVVSDRALAPQTHTRPLPRLTADVSELPDLETAWLWAHAQALTDTGEDLEQILRTNPERALSRLIAPRRLQAQQRYLACVVPTFEAGRLAGLGLDATTATSLAPAWMHGAAPHQVELPVYYFWRFSTSETGDFEQLARRIQAFRMGQSGVRSLDVGYAGSGLPGPAAGQSKWEIQLEGVAIGSQIQPGAWPGPAQAELQAAIAVRLAASEHELAPPTYGSLLSGHAGSLANDAGPRWLRELNLDPRYRATASLGTRIVQKHQEALVASAWEQTAEMREANRLLRQAQLARTVGGVLEERLVGNLDQERLLQLTNAIHDRVVSGSTTVAKAKRPNAAVMSSTSLAFRRVSRPAGPLARRLTHTPLSSPLFRLAAPSNNAAALRPTPELRAVTGLVNLADVSDESANEPESFASLTEARALRQDVFPWEAETPERPVRVPIGYLADLVIAARTNEADWWARTTKHYIARALDFEGVPQLGWERLDRAPTGDASTYVERHWTRGRLIADVQTWTASGQNGFSIGVGFTPGFMLEPEMETSWSGVPREVLIAANPPPPASGESFERVSIAAADLAENSGIDIVLAYRGSYTITHGGWSRSERQWRVTVGLGFDPSTGSVEQWTEPSLLGEAGGELTGIAAAGRQVYLINGSTLQILTLAADGSVTEQATVDLGPHVPEDVVASTIVAADFGARTGTDLLVYYSAGQDASARAGYVIAYDVQSDGRINGWSDVHDVPLGSIADLAILLGTSTAAAAQQRAETTQAFREAAAATQARQQRILPASAPPEPAPAVDAAQLANDVGAAIAPEETVVAALEARLSLATPIDPASVDDPLQPLAFTPRFPFPTFELIRDAYQERLFPGVSDLPADSASAVVVNPKVIEAFLVGLNHEMSRELLWRGFPVRHGTFFDRFWLAQRPEITPIETWAANSVLGDHLPSDTPFPSLLFVVRAELLRRIPDAIVYAAPAIESTTDSSRRTVNLSARVDPLFTGKLHPDIRFFGFELTADTVRGSGSSDGWYFVFQQRPTAQRFGLDEDSGSYGTTPATWANVDWSQVVTTAEELAGLVYVDAGSASPLAGITLADGGASALSHRWDFSAAHMAHITIQRPVQLARHGSDLIAPEEQT